MDFCQSQVGEPIPDTESHASKPREISCRLGSLVTGIPVLISRLEFPHRPVDRVVELSDFLAQLAHTAAGVPTGGIDDPVVRTRHEFVEFPLVRR